MDYAAKRIEKLRSFMQKNGIAAAVFKLPENTQYFSGFSAIVYSRPIIFIVEEAKTTLLIPGLEEDHALAVSSPSVDEFKVYYEHPEKEYIGIDPNRMLKDIISKYPMHSKIGIEFSFQPYKTAKMIEGWGYELFDVSPIATEMRFVKDEYELDCIRECSRLCRIGQEASFKAAHAGMTEMEYEIAGTEAIFREISKPGYGYTFGSPFAITPSGVARTNMPHVTSSTRILQKGEHIIHVRKPSVNGYLAELERTIFIGRPDAQQERAFNAMLEAQQTGFECLRPGITCREIDRIVRDVLRKYGYQDYAIHRVGHGIGLGRHEEPYLNFYSDLVIEENMVFTVEPGIYIPETGGFRHSDTLVVHKDGVENLSEWNNRLEDLIIEA